VVVVCCYRWWRPPQELESWQVGCSPSGVVMVVAVAPREHSLVSKTK